MKKFALAVFVCLSVLALSQDSSEPPGYGVYYKTGDSWQKLVYMTPTNVSSGAFSGVTLSYHGAESITQIADHHPVFYFDSIPTASNMLIVVFEKKQDSRDVKVMRSRVVAVKGGPDKKHVVDVAVKELNNHLISIAPSRDLQSGEYLLTDTSGYGGYDFGVK